MTPTTGSIAVRVLRATGRALLTVFVLWQFVFLVSSNFLGVEEPLRTWFKDWYWKDNAHAEVPVPEYLQGKGKIHDDYYAPLEKWDRHWGQLTGQPEHWGLFAPTVGDVAPFPAVEFRWDDQDWPEWADRPPLPEHPPKTAVMLSDNEPTNRHRFVKSGCFRVRKFEAEIVPYVSPKDGILMPATSEWQEKISDKVRGESDSIFNYLCWRLQVYRAANPDAPPPTQVILLLRSFKIPQPPGPEPWDWIDVGEYRIARWLPTATLDRKQYREVERYDPITDHFERMEK